MAILVDKEMQLYNDKSEYLGSLPLTAFGRFGSPVVMDVAELETAIKELIKRREMAVCLDMVLFLLDPEVKLLTKKRVAEELEPALNTQSIEHVLNIILSRPLPTTVDRTILQYSINANSTIKLLNTILQSQVIVRKVYRCWLEVSRSFPKQECDDVFARLSFQGVFREFALSEKNTDGLQQLAHRTFGNKSFHNAIDSTPKIINDVVSEMQVAFAEFATISTDNEVQNGSITELAPKTQIPRTTRRLQMRNIKEYALLFTLYPIVALPLLILSCAAFSAICLIQKIRSFNTAKLERQSQMKPI